MSRDFPLDKFREFINKTEEKEPVEEIKPISETVVTDSVKTTPVVEKIQLSEKEEFESLNLSKDDLLEIKKIALSDILSEDISISELVDLVLLQKTGKTVKEKNREGLLIREYVDREGKITKQGRLYLEFDETKERLQKLLK